MYFNPKCQLDICYKAWTEKKISPNKFFPFYRKKDTKVSLFIWMSRGVKHNAENLSCFYFSSLCSSLFFSLALPLKFTEEKVKWNLKNDFWLGTLFFYYFFRITSVSRWKTNLICINFSCRHESLLRCCHFIIRNWWNDSSSICVYTYLYNYNNYFAYFMMLIEGIFAGKFSFLHI